MTREEAETKAWEEYDKQAAMPHKIIEKLCDVEESEEGWMAEVIGIMTGCPNWVFWSIDDAPRKYGYEHGGRHWHHKLRQVRNHPEFGPELFDVLLPPNKNALEPKW